MPILPALLDIVEFIFHIRSERNVHNVGEIFDEHIGYSERDIRGNYIFVFFRGVFTFGKDGNDRRVSGRSADSLFFHYSDEARVGESYRRLGAPLFLF